MKPSLKANGYNQEYIYRMGTEYAMILDGLDEEPGIPVDSVFPDHEDSVLQAEYVDISRFFD